LEDQDQPGPAAMLRDLTEAVAEVAERLLGPPEEDAL
jgi:hypothetical protein